MLGALVKGNVKQAKLMLKVGSDPNQKDAIGRTPLIMLSYYRDEQKAISLANYIIKLGGKIDNTDDNGMNALHHACEKRKIKLAGFLLSYRDDYDVFAKDKDGQLCADYISGKQSEDLLRKVKSIAVEYGLDPTVFQIKVPAKQPIVKGSRIQSSGEAYLQKARITTASSIPHQAGQSEQEDQICEQNEAGYFKTRRYTYVKRKKGNFYNKSITTRQSLLNINSRTTNDFNNKIPIYKKFSSKNRSNNFEKKCTLSSSYGHGKKHRKDYAENPEAMLKQQKSTIGTKECSRGHKNSESSRELLAKILKIYEKQHSTFYREGAKERTIEEHFDSNNATPSSNNILEEEIQLIPTGRTSRSMSLVPGNQPAVVKKRRPSRVSLQYNKQLKIKLTDTSMKPNALQQRRFSSITSATFIPKPMSPENTASSNVSRVLSLSASNISLIKKLNAERKSANDTNILFKNNLTLRESKVNFTTTEMPKVKGRNIEKKVSSLPALTVFVETGEQSESPED